MKNKKDFSISGSAPSPITPKHYATDNIDVIDFCKLYKLDFNKGNIVKYICRAGKKDNELEDLEKALDYLQREIEYVKKMLKF